MKMENLIPSSVPVFARMES